MKNLVKNASVGIVLVIALIVVFSSGFFTGRETRIGNNYFGDSVGASGDVDLSVFWKVWDIIEDKYIPASSTIAVSEQDKVFGATKGLVDSLQDPYSEFLLPEENKRFETAIQGEFSGIGMEVGLKDEKIVVVTPLKNTPAEKAGILAGDIILAIDGVPTTSFSLDKAVSMIRGEIGTTVKLTILREGLGEPLEISVVRAKINIPTLETKEVEDVFVISLYNFSANANNDFREALRKFILSDKQKLILDLRGNPGGFLESAVDMASWFLPAGKIIVREDFGSREKIFRSKGYDVFNDKLKMAILVDSGSASASEILAGALSEYGKAKIIGTNTFGKGSVQELISVTKDTSLKLTIARWLTPNGLSISDGGITPDVIVDVAPEGIKLSDFQLQKAIAELR